jgi:hypothetical protein
MSTEIAFGFCRKIHSLLKQLQHNRVASGSFLFSVIALEKEEGIP